MFMLFDMVNFFLLFNVFVMYSLIFVNVFNEIKKLLGLINRGFEFIWY